MSEERPPHLRAVPNEEESQPPVNDGEGRPPLEPEPIQEGAEVHQLFPEEHVQPPVYATPPNPFAGMGPVFFELGMAAVAGAFVGGVVGRGDVQSILIGAGANAALFGSYRVATAREAQTTQRVILGALALGAGAGAAYLTWRR